VFLYKFTCFALNSGWWMVTIFTFYLYCCFCCRRQHTILNMKYCVYVCPVSLAELCIAKRQDDNSIFCMYGCSNVCLDDQIYDVFDVTGI
jgi:hypothetical protein